MMSFSLLCGWCRCPQGAEGRAAAVPVRVAAARGPMPQRPGLTRHTALVRLFHIISRHLLLAPLSALHPDWHAVHSYPHMLMLSLSSHFHHFSHFHNSSHFHHSSHITTPLTFTTLILFHNSHSFSHFVTSRDSVVLRHAFFSGASSRLPSGHVLHHLATIYIVRSVDLWKTEEVREKSEKRVKGGTTVGLKTYRHDNAGKACVCVWKRKQGFERSLWECFERGAFRETFRRIM